MDETRPGVTNQTLQRSVDLLVAELVQEMAKVEQLKEAVASRDVIGQAKGILMERLKVDADEAFEILRKMSNTTNLKVHDVAEYLTRTGTLEPGP